MKSLSRRQWRLIVLGAVVTLVVFLWFQWNAAIKRNRSVPDEPFQIAGNLYYVGSTGVTAFLLTGPEGHVLIDGGYPETAPLIMGSIARIGFDIADVKVLLNSHAHFDHAGGLRELQEIFLASHGSFFGLDRKLRERADAKDPAEPFIDRDGYLSFIDRAEARFREELADQQ